MARLKKGSAAAKAWGRKMKRLRNSKSKPKRKRSRSSPVRRSRIKRRIRSTMAKRRKAPRRRSRTMSVWGINMGKAGSAGLYGAVRARLSNTIRPYTARLPLGVVSDEVGMVIALQALKKFAFKKAGILRDAATTGQAIEFARIGEAAATGQLNLGGILPQSNGASGLKF